MLAGQSAVVDRVLVFFADGEILEGAVDALDLDRPDFDLHLSDPDANNECVLVPLPSVKRICTGRHPVRRSLQTDQLQKVAIRFRDGEVVKGLLAGGPQRAHHGVWVELVDPDGDELVVLGIPYANLKAVFSLKSWDSRPAEFISLTRRWEGRRTDAPLIDLLDEIRRLTVLRDRGDITHEDFQVRRHAVLRHM
jgi:hypothetical protein